MERPVHGRVRGTPLTDKEISDALYKLKREVNADGVKRRRARTENMLALKHAKKT